MTKIIIKKVLIGIPGGLRVVLSAYCAAAIGTIIAKIVGVHAATGHFPPFAAAVWVFAFAGICSLFMNSFFTTKEHEGTLRREEVEKVEKQQNEDNWAKCKEATYNGYPHIKSFAGSRGGFSKEPLAAGGIGEWCRVNYFTRI